MLTNLKAVSIILLLSAAVVLPSVSSAFAMPSDADKPGHTKLLAKSYGTKTKNLVCGEQLCSDSNEFPTLKGFKKEIVKTYKKIMEQYRAQNLLKI